MSRTVRYALAVVGGAVVAVASVAGIQAVGHAVYPPPAGLDVSNPEQLRLYMQVVPFGAMLFVVAAWLIATFAGALVARLIARDRPLLFAGIVGALILAGTIANVLAIPHPVWMVVAGLVGVPLAALLASRVPLAGRATEA